jgi:hypothetical protein
VEGGLLLDVVIRQGAAILQLLPRKDETLLVRGNSIELYISIRDGVWEITLPLFVLDLRLYIIDRVRGLDLESDGLSGEGLNEDLHFLRYGVVEEVVNFARAYIGQAGGV